MQELNNFQGLQCLDGRFHGNWVAKGVCSITILEAVRISCKLQGYNSCSIRMDLNIIADSTLSREISVVGMHRTEYYTPNRNEEIFNEYELLTSVYIHSSKFNWVAYNSILQMLEELRCLPLLIDI